MAAFLLLLHLCGPEAVPNSQLPSTAQSREQAAVLFNLAAKIVRLSPDLDAVVSDPRHDEGVALPGLGTRYRALSAEDTTAHGQSPVFAIHDELGQVRGPVSKLYKAIENAMGAHEAPMSIVISTQAPTDADLLSVLIDNALDEADPTTVLASTRPIRCWTRSRTRRCCSESGGGRLPEHEGTAAPGGECAADAVAGGALPELPLNQRVDAVRRSCRGRSGRPAAAQVVPDFAGLPVFAGLDLSACPT